MKAIRADCTVATAACVEGNVRFVPMRHIDDKARQIANTRLVSIEKEFRKIGLRITAETVIDLLNDLKRTDVTRNFQWLDEQIENIEKLVHKELHQKLFLYIAPEQQRFLPTEGKRNLFGEEVADAFPSANYEISEAGWCLALTRGSAAVFHLMRILEIGLAAFGAVFGVSLAHTNWEPALREIESKVRDMHKDPSWKALADCKEKQESYAQAASHFGILKDAWRNYTMHVRGVYTEDGAEQIFMSVKGFMRNLASLGLRERSEKV